MSMSGQLWRCVSRVERDSAAMNACVHALQEFDRVEAQLQAAQQAILQQPSFEEVTALAADLTGARQQAETSQEMVEPASSRPIPERFPLAASQKLELLNLLSATGCDCASLILRPTGSPVVCLHNTAWQSEVGYAPSDMPQITLQYSHLHKLQRMLIGHA